jgi:hypothetical protein
MTADGVSTSARESHHSVVVRIARPQAAGTSSTARPSTSSQLTRAQIERQTATAPQNACVCVIARCVGLRTTATASNARATVESGSAVTVTRPAGRVPLSIASTMSRNSPDDEIASRRSPSRQRNVSLATSPLGTAITSFGQRSPASDASQSA